jgi:APA family basic amino acid/polyamine antiporter
MPWVPILGALSCIAQMLSLPLATWIRLVVWLLIGFAMYFGYARRRSRFAVAQL